jgi:hypothetical protein
LRPDIARAEEAFAGKYGWTANPATHVWETDPDLKEND